MIRKYAESKDHTSTYIFYRIVPLQKFLILEIKSIHNSETFWDIFVTLCTNIAQYIIGERPVVKWLYRECEARVIYSLTTDEQPVTI